jgi:hypothetical protein
MKDFLTLLIPPTLIIFALVLLISLFFA